MEKRPAPPGSPDPATDRSTRAVEAAVAPVKDRTKTPEAWGMQAASPAPVRSAAMADAAGPFPAAAAWRPAAPRLLEEAKVEEAKVAEALVPLALVAVRPEEMVAGQVAAPIEPAPRPSASVPALSALPADRRRRSWTPAPAAAEVPEYPPAGSPPAARRRWPDAGPAKGRRSSR